jgi:hypothetical protein
MSNSILSNKGFTDLLPQTVEHKDLEGEAKAAEEKPKEVAEEKPKEATTEVLTFEGLAQPKTEEAKHT